MYNEKLLRKSYAQSVACLVGLSDEETGARWYAALDKARTEIEGKNEIPANKTIRFDRANRVLRFVSRFSGKRRIVTEFGCHETCDCNGRISYHRAVWEILNRYYSLLEDEPTERPYLQGRLSNAKRESLGNIRF